MADSPSFRLLLDHFADGKTDDAAASLFKRYASRLIALSAAKMSNKLKQLESPEDIMQSAFGTFFKHVKNGQFELRDWESLWGLLAQIAARRIIKKEKHYRAEKRGKGQDQPLDEGAPVPDREPSPEEIAIAIELREQFLNELPERYRAIAVQILEGDTHEIIAQSLSTSISTVERVHRRARETLTKLRASEESD